MAIRIVFGIISHGHRFALDDLLKNLSETCPNSETIVFNTGSSSEWLDGFEGKVSRSSREMEWGRIADAHFSLMEDIAGRSDYDCLVTLDSDMLMIKDGFEEKTSSLLKMFAYIGTEFAPFGRYEENFPMSSVIHHWERYWARLLDAQTPYAVVNPGQVFRRDFVEFLVRDSRTFGVLDAVRRARTPVLEEVVYPTLAVARGFPATCNPGTHAIEQRTFSPDELVLHHAHPDVFLVHKVSLAEDAPDRMMIHSLASRGPSAESVIAAAGRVAELKLPAKPPSTRLERGVYTLRRAKQILRGP